MSTDRIEKKTVLRAPRAKVWRALANAEEFGSWFGVKLVGAFVPGSRLTGHMTYPGYEHVTIDVLTVQVEPEQLLSFRWHPYAIEPNLDYSGEPTTLVEFKLADAPEGTQLTVVESGFDQIPVHRRAEAYRSDDEGWTGQLTNIERYVTS